MTLEVIARDAKDIEIINTTNADRIELCDHLEVGGLTPTHAVIDKSLAVALKPVNIMIRPHADSFVYTDADFKQILADIDYVINSGANGIVIGMLTADNLIDVNRMKIVVKHAGNADITFHKAFDEVSNKLVALKQLETLGITNILTSGGEIIDNNFTILQELTNSASTINIIAGGGVSFANVHEVVKCVDQVHVGTSVRNGKTFTKPVNAKLVNEMKEKVTIRF